LTEEELTSFEHILNRLLRIHLGKYMPLNDVDLDAEIEKLEKHYPEHIIDPNLLEKLE